MEGSELNFNRNGKIKKSDLLLNEDAEIFDSMPSGLVNYNELKKELLKEYNIKIDWTDEEKIKYTNVYYCSSENRGCSPLYLTDDIYLTIREEQ